MRHLRYFICLILLASSGHVNAAFYRVFLVDKGKDLPVETDLPVHPGYIREIESLGGKIIMQSRWLNYVLIETDTLSPLIRSLSFVKNIEELGPGKPHEVLSFPVNETPTDDHREWQLDTMGYRFFKQQGIDGKGIRIAVIDAGFTGADKSDAFTHIFSSGRVLFTYDLLDNDSNVFHGSYHGSMVWSCIAGNMNDKPTGLATGASFILLRSEDEKTETTADEDRWIQALEMAVLNGADIVSSSVGFSVPLHKKEELNGRSLIAQAADIAAGKGVLIVQSAGNEYITLWKTLITPADAEKVITAGAIDRQGNHAFFSSVGPTADGRSKPDVVAPGVCVAVKENSFVLVNGTSFSAPLTTGYLACMLQWKGKTNITRDSVLHYAGLYPYHDHVFGYGVPAPVPQKNEILFQDSVFTVNKTEGTIKKNDPGKKDIWIFLKIENKKGDIKFSDHIRLTAKRGYKVPTTGSRNMFEHSKYINPQPDDTWTFWWNGRVYSY